MFSVEANEGINECGMTENSGYEIPGMCHCLIDFGRDKKVETYKRDDSSYTRPYSIRYRKQTNVLSEFLQFCLKVHQISFFNQHQKSNAQSSVNIIIFDTCWKAHLHILYFAIMNVSSRLNGKELSKITTTNSDKAQLNGRPKMVLRINWVRPRHLKKARIFTFNRSSSSSPSLSSQLSSCWCRATSVIF